MTTELSQDTADYSPPPPVAAPAVTQPASSQVRADLAALSHTGNVRESNEDVFLVVRFGRALQTLLTNLPEGLVPDRSAEEGYGLLVADGVGGSAAGEIASQMAVSTLVSLVLDTPDWVLLAGDQEREKVMERFSQRYHQVDAILRAEGQADPALAGMGTTMTLACNLGADLILSHIGDSRAYLLRGADFRQLTRDHTYAQELVDAGVIQPEDVETHRFRHVLTRALGGTGPRAGTEVQYVRLGDGDQVLLCSDGLTDMVDDVAIAAVLREAGTARAACDALVEMALKNGGKDNVTVVLARYRFAPEP
jgi:protein phosphatase